MKRLAALLLAGACAAGAVRAAEPPDLELKVKAAYLFNFAKFVDWGAAKLGEPEAPIQICIAAAGAFAGIVDQTVQGKRVAGHPLLVRRVESGDDLASCHILYAGSRDQRTLGVLFAPAAGAGVMTIHEADDPLPGGVARLYLEQDRVRFEINIAAAEREHLQISSKLLSVASVVQR